jgi:ankyrin repeat protein
VFKLGRKATPFWQALLDGNRSELQALLQDSPELSQAAIPQRLARRYETVTPGATPLHVAAAEGDAQLTRVLVQLGGEVDAADESHQTPLHTAALAGQGELVKLLLRREASVTVTDARQQTPLHAAGRGGSDTAALALIDAGADLHQEDGAGNTPLHCAVAGGCEQTVAHLLDAGAAVNACNERGRTPLHTVVISEDHSVYSHIDPDRLDRRHCMERIAKQLLERGADANAVDATGSTALDLFEFLEGNRDDDPLVQQLRNYGGQWFRYRHRHSEELSQASHFGTHHAMPAQSGGGGDNGAGIAQEAAGEAISLTNRTVLIGRSRECDIRYKSRTLSRHHACIRPQGGQYIIQDEGSRNGIVINGEKVGQSHVLEPGDIITLGVYEFAFDGQSITPLTEELDEAQLSAEGQK